MKDLLDLFMEMSVGDLTLILKTLDIETKGRLKLDKIQLLLEFYSNLSNYPRLWKNLSDYEKEFVTCVVQSDYHPHNSELEMIAKKHSVILKKNSNYDSVQYYSSKSMIHAIIIAGRVPNYIREQLKILIPKYQPEFEVLEDLKQLEKSVWQVSNREARYGDFDMLIKFVNSQKVKATKANHFINKNSLIAFYKTVQYDEIFQENVTEMNKLRKMSDASISNGMAQLLRAANVLKIEEDLYKLGENAIDFINLDMPMKAKFLFDSFMDSLIIIDETKNIKVEQCMLNCTASDIRQTRHTIVDVLRMCPPRKWISAIEFEKQLRKVDYNFLKKLYNSPYTTRDRFYYVNGYDSEHDAEFYYIDVVLLDYLCVLGVLDVVTHRAKEYYFPPPFQVTKYFRITALGEYLLGITEEYIPEQTPVIVEDKGILVQPNFEIIVPSGKRRIPYEIYFDRFLNSVTEDAEATVYKLDFAGIVNALDMGLEIEGILEYLQTYSSVSIPDNVVRMFRDWETASKRIRIRTITIVETDDEFLFEEIKTYSRMKENTIGDVKNALMIAPQKAPKVKRIIEKYKRFCVISK